MTPPLTPPFYVVSDSHFFHDNIVKYAGRHEQIKKLTAKGQVVLDHNEYMVEKWNSVVGDDDKILHLGDLFCWFKNGKEKFEAKILDRLKGEKYLILGNHDREEMSEYERMGFTVVRPFSAKINGRKVSFDHYPMGFGRDPGDTIRVHGHIHNSGYSLTDDRHDHRSTPRRRGHINVSVEAIDYTPVLISDILRPNPKGNE